MSSSRTPAVLTSRCQSRSLPSVDNTGETGATGVTFGGVRGIGTVVNVVTVLAGTLAGVLIGGRLPERLRTAVLQVVGLVTLVIGGRTPSAPEWCSRWWRSSWGRSLAPPCLSNTSRVPGRLIRRRFEGDREGDDCRFVEGFVAASLLFCVGPLTTLGSIRDGLGGPDHAQLLLVKAALDGTVAMAFDSTLGWGVGFSALTLIVVQGTLTLVAGAADQVLTERMIVEMSAALGVIMMGIGLRLLDIKQVAVGSFLPALVLAPLGSPSSPAGRGLIGGGGGVTRARHERGQVGLGLGGGLEELPHAGDLQVADDPAGRSIAALHSIQATRSLVGSGGGRSSTGPH